MDRIPTLKRPCADCGAEDRLNDAGLCADCEREPVSSIRKQLRAQNFAMELAAARCESAAPDDFERPGRNQRQADEAEAVLKRYNLATGADLQEVIAQLMADLGHFCDRHNLDMFEQWLEAAKLYKVETRESGVQFHAK